MALDSQELKFVLVEIENIEARLATLKAHVEQLMASEDSDAEELALPEDNLKASIDGVWEESMAKLIQGFEEA